MAKNLVYPAQDTVLSNTAPTAGAATSGAPGVVGNIPVVALNTLGEGGNDSGAADLQTAGRFDLEVVGEDGSGNAAIAAGDIIYWDATELNADDANGVRFGYALAAVASGATTTITVKVGY